MRQEDFESALARFGPEPDLWPESARAAALEGAFADLRAVPARAPDALLSRVMADAADIAAARAAPRNPRPGWLAAIAAKARHAFSTPILRPAMACAACAVLGLWLGQTTMVASAATTLFPAEEAAGALAFSDDGLGGVEIAFGYGEEGWE
ncbi:MAG: hypothetical protein WD969_17145 [Paracoccaceae bacterium]